MLIVLSISLQPTFVARLKLFSLKKEKKHMVTCILKAIDGMAIVVGSKLEIS